MFGCPPYPSVLCSLICACPRLTVFEKLHVEFFDSHYWNPSATLKLSFNVTQDPLYAKDKYKVKITFPNNQGVR